MPKLVQTVPKTEVTTEAQTVALCNAINALKLVSFDTETTSVDPHTAKCLLVSFSLPPVVWDESWGSKSVFGSEPFQPEFGSRFVFEAANPHTTPLVYMLGVKGVDVVAHNFKYDAHIIYRHWGVMPGEGGRVFDTMIMDHVINENRSTIGRHGLKECCIDYGIYHGLEKFGALFPSPPKSVLKVRPNLSPSEYALETQRDIFLEYAATDAYVTMLLFDFLREHLKTEPWDGPDGTEGLTFWDYYLRYEEPFIRSIWEMEKNGVKCEPSRLAGYRPKIVQRMADIEGHYAQLAGQVVNLNSNPQLRSLLIDTLGLPVVKYTKGGASGDKKPALDNEALEIYHEDYPEVVEPLMEYRKISKLLGTYIDGLSTHIQNDGRIRGNFNIHVAVTNRLSSSQPNLQNIENADPDDDHTLEYDIRKAFVAGEGNKLVVCDLNQLEVVITSQVTQDENLIKVLLEGLDLHSYTAHLMFDILYEEMIAAKKAAAPTDEQKKLVKLRKAAKTLQFGMLYGMGAHTLAKRLGVTEEVAQEYIDQYFVAYPGILRAKNYWTDFCFANGYVKTLMGRRRRLPEILNDSYKVQARAKRQLFNAIIQGSAADMMRDYMPAIAFNPDLKKMGAKLCVQVHDEVVVEVPERYADEACPIVEKLMCGALSFVDWRVPLAADAKIAKTWSEGK